MHQETVWLIRRHIIACIGGCFFGFLFIVPSSQDYDFIILINIYQRHFPKSADVVCLAYRATFTIGAILTILPCYQMAYIEIRTKFQKRIELEVLESIDCDLKNLSDRKAFIDSCYQNNVYKKLRICLQRHVLQLELGAEINKHSSIFIFLFAVAGTLHIVSICLCLFLVSI